MAESLLGMQRIAGSILGMSRKGWERPSLCRGGVALPDREDTIELRWTHGFLLRQTSYPNSPKPFGSDAARASAPNSASLEPVAVDSDVLVVGWWGGWLVGSKVGGSRLADISGC